MALDVIFRSLEPTIRPPENSISPVLLASVAASDPCEAQFFTAQTFLEAVYGGDTGRNSRAQTPMSCSSRANTPSMVRNPIPQVDADNPCRAPNLFGLHRRIFPMGPLAPKMSSVQQASFSPNRKDTSAASRYSLRQVAPGSPNHPLPPHTVKNGKEQSC